jgi:two-component system chemotaxis response regulator CheY
MANRQVLNVGQCGVDHTSVRWLLQREFAATVVPAATTAEALAQLRRGRFDLVLVNRILDRDGSSGLDLIRQLHEDNALQEIPVMLVSNYADAQQEAEALGARPGFGKAELDRPQTLARLREILG